MASIATPMPGADSSASSAPVIESGRDLLASVPSDLFDGIEDTPDPSSDADDTGAETFETPEEIGADDTPADDAPVDDDVPADDAVPPVDDKKDAKPADTPEELPEGVKRGKDRNGKDGLFVPEARWNTIHGNHKLIQDLGGVLGEPATLEALTLRNEAFRGQERLFNDLNSGVEASQKGVIGYMFDEMARAQRDGEVGVDPSVSFAKSFYDTAKEKGSDAYANLRLSAAKDLVDEMFHEAASSGDKALFVSAQHMARKLAGFGADVADMAAVRAATDRMGIKVYTWDEADGLKQGSKVDPLAALRAENELLKSKVNGGSGNDQAAQFGAWQTATNTAIKTGIRDKALKPALEGVAKSWEKFPTEYQELVVDRLHRKVDEVLNSDAKFKANIASLKDRAKRAVSAQVRDTLAGQIETAYVHRAEQALDGVKKPVLEFAATWLKDRSDQAHTRRESAQTRTTPRGTSGTVPRSLIPNDLPQFKNGMFDTATAMKQAEKFLR